MKKLFLVSLMVLLLQQVNAQFTKATLQATGLTCAMCSNAINKALQKVPFVESVRSDIKNSAFNIVFRQGQEVNIDALKDAVEDAGFSVGSLVITGNFQEQKIEADQHIRIGTAVFMFVGAKSQTLNGEQTITVVDKGFVSAKQFKKICTVTTMTCVLTGKGASCCSKDGITADTRVYHVTI